MTVRPRKQLHLAALPYAGEDSGADWAGSRVSSQIEFAPFERLARTAERGLFDFLLLADELRLREHRGRIHDLDVAGRPEPVTVLAALAAVTERIGLAATADVTFNEPYELACRLATLDHLSASRAAWNVAISQDAPTSGNFRRGDSLGLLDKAGRYDRATEFVEAARELWDSWTPDGVARPFAHRGRHFDIAGEFGVPRSPQGHPVVIRAGDSPADREFAASAADVVLARHRTPEAGREFYADVKGRLARYGRAAEDLKILPGATFVLGDTAAEAQERAFELRRQQISPQLALHALERIWGTDLSSYDPDGPLPDIDPVTGPEREDPTGPTDPTGLTSPIGPIGLADPTALAEEWRALSRAKGLSIRGTVIEASGRQSFIGTPEAVAVELDEFVRTGAADGFVLVPHPAPDGLGEFVDRVVPLLQERGAYRTEYTGTTLRSHLGLPHPVWKG